MNYSKSAYVNSLFNIHQFYALIKDRKMMFKFLFILSEKQNAFKFDIFTLRGYFAPFFHVRFQNWIRAGLLSTVSAH